jgi:hypothetical protein
MIRFVINQYRLGLRVGLHRRKALARAVNSYYQGV